MTFVFLASLALASCGHAKTAMSGGRDELQGRWEKARAPERHCATSMEFLPDGTLTATDDNECDVLIASYGIDSSAHPPELVLEGNRSEYHLSGDELRLTSGGQTSVLHRAPRSKELAGTLQDLAGSWRGLMWGFTALEVHEDGTAVFEDKPAVFHVLDGSVSPHRVIITTDEHMSPCIYRVTRDTFTLLCGPFDSHGFPDSFRQPDGSGLRAVGFYRSK